MPGARKQFCEIIIDGNSRFDHGTASCHQLPLAFVQAAVRSAHRRTRCRPGPAIKPIAKEPMITQRHDARVSDWFSYILFIHSISDIRSRSCVCSPRCWLNEQLEVMRIEYRSNQDPEIAVSPCVTFGWPLNLSTKIVMRLICLSSRKTDGTKILQP